MAGSKRTDEERFKEAIDFRMHPRSVSIPGGGLLGPGTARRLAVQNQLVKRLLPKATQLPSACTMYGHSQCAVHVLRGDIRLRRRVEDQPHRFSTRAFLNVIVSLYTYLPMRVDVDASTKDAAAPIGQLKGHHRLRDHLSVSFNNEISLGLDAPALRTPAGAARAKVSSADARL